MNMKTVAMTATLLGGAVFAGPTMAQVVSEHVSGDQGSVVAFPFYTGDGNVTTLRLVNSGPTTVNVHFVRVCHGIKDSDHLCRKLDKSKSLTANETLLIPNVKTEFNTQNDASGPPNCKFGYIIAYAESGFNTKIPISYNHLYGDVHIDKTANGETAGRRLGGAPAIAIRSPQAENAVLGAAGILTFDGVQLEQVHSRLKTLFRAGVNSTRTSKIFLATWDIHAGAQNPPTLTDLDAFSQDEVPTSGNLEYVCSVLVDANDQNQLQGILKQSELGTVHGSLKIAVDGPEAIFGYVLREEGNGKRSLEPMWIDDGGATSTTFEE